MFCLGNLFKKESPLGQPSLPDWSVEPKWTKEATDLLNEVDISDLSLQTVEDIIDKSEHFSVKFPTKNNRCTFLKSVVEENTLTRNIHSTYPVIHERVLKLCCDFLLFKRTYGNEIEQKFYSNINILEFIDRLLKKRAVCFVGPFDKYMLLDGTTGISQWEDIGTSKQKQPLTLENYLSYDELKISALVSVSSYTYFVNDGNRSNKSVYQEDRSNVEDEGIIIGLIGPRLHKTNAVENQEIVFSKTCQTKENGFGTSVQHSVPKLFADFYDEKCLDYKEMLKIMSSDNNGRYVLLFGYDNVFDNSFYYKRLTISIDTLLGEANSRGKKASKLAYVHVVGIGLGVWKVSPHQDKKFMDTFAKRICSLGDKLDYISDICFAHMVETKCGKFSNGDVIPIEGHPNGGIKIHFNNRSPHEKLQEDSKDKLLVASYAWDGNALPGNEYWFGSLASSSDPAAACSTQVAELHNPHINPLVCAANLGIVTEASVVTIREYRQKLKSII